MKRPRADVISQSDALIELFEEKASEWYKNPPQKLELPKKDITYKDLVLALHLCNFVLWNKEELVRDSSTSYEMAANLKRAIDAINWHRNEIVGRIDGLAASVLNIVESTDWSNMYINSETLGQMIDRQSILVLKISFNKSMSIRKDLDISLRDKCSLRLRELELQLRYVAECYRRFVAHLDNGTGCMLPFKQHKMYRVDDLRR